MISIEMNAVQFLVAVCKHVEQDVSKSSCY